MNPFTVKGRSLLAKKLDLKKQTNKLKLVEL